MSAKSYFAVDCDLDILSISHEENNTNIKNQAVWSLPKCSESWKRQQRENLTGLNSRWLNVFGKYVAITEI